MSLYSYPDPFILILSVSPISRTSFLPLVFASSLPALQFLQAILSPVHVVSHTAAQILAAYGAVDTERGDWPTLLPALLNNIANPEVAVQPKVSSLEVCVLRMKCERPGSIVCLAIHVNCSLLSSWWLTPPSSFFLIIKWIHFVYLRPTLTVSPLSSLLFLPFYPCPGFGLHVWCYEPRWDRPCSCGSYTLGHHRWDACWSSQWGMYGTRCVILINYSPPRPLQHIPCLYHIFCSSGFFSCLVFCFTSSLLNLTFALSRCVWLV